MQTVDFIVVGSGIAGLNAALELSEHGSVLVVTKGNIKDTATNLAQGGIAAVSEKKDSFALHVNDTLIAGAFHNSKKAVEFLVRQGSKVIDRLVQLGVCFDSDSSFEAAHSYPRVLHASDFTGREIEKALVSRVLKSSAITVWKDSFAADLIADGNKCLGTQIIKNSSVIPIFSRAVALATGGVGQLYRWTTNPEVATGDGIAIAYRAGAKLSDLEFVQFHPTALRHGKSPLFLLSEALRGEGAVLKKLKVQSSKFKIKDGERFMEQIDSRKELAPRDIVARAIFQQQQNGYEVYLDIRHKGNSFLQKRFPNIYQELKKRGFDLGSDLIPVAPAAHYMCGGIATDLFGRTSIKNLFAYGEVASTGVHGANRLASNSLLEGMVFSSQIKKCIGEVPKKAKEIKLTKLSYNKGRDVYDCKENVKDIMWKHVGIVRTKRGLQHAVSELKKLKEKIDSIKAVNENTLEVKNMVQVALLIAREAHKRKKSLGAHYMINDQ